MPAQVNYFDQMARRVRAGDTYVKSRLQVELETQLNVIVRAALSSANCQRPLHRQIRELARTDSSLTPTGAVDPRTISRVLSHRIVRNVAPSKTEACDLAETILA